MDFKLLNFDFNDITWKKIAVGFLVTAFIFMLIRCIFIFTFFNEAKKLSDNFNFAFDKGQSAIHQKINAEFDDFDKRGAELDKMGKPSDPLKDNESLKVVDKYKTEIEEFHKLHPTDDLMLLIDQKNRVIDDLTREVERQRSIIEKHLIDDKRRIN